MVLFTIVLCDNAIIVPLYALSKQVRGFLGPDNFTPGCGRHKRLSEIGRTPGSELDSRENGFDSGWHFKNCRAGWKSNNILVVQTLWKRISLICQELLHTANDGKTLMHCGRAFIGCKPRIMAASENASMALIAILKRISPTEALTRWQWRQ